MAARPGQTFRVIGKKGALVRKSAALASELLGALPPGGRAAARTGWAAGASRVEIVADVLGPRGEPNFV